MCANTGFEFCTQITFFDAMYEVAGDTDRGRSYRVIQDDDDMDTGNHSLSALSLQFSPTRRNHLWMNSCSTTKQRHIRLRNCEPRVPTSSNASAPTTCDHNWARVFKFLGSPAPGVPSANEVSHSFPGLHYRGNADPTRPR